MITMLALLAMANNPSAIVNTGEPITDPTFDKDVIITLISEQIRLEVESISTELSTELQAPSLVAERSLKKVLENVPKESIGDE